MRKELWSVLKLPRIFYFYSNMSFKIPNMVVKCSRSLFLSHYITLKMVISLCCILLHSEFPERISLCFTDVGIIKTSQETTNFFRTDFFFILGAFQVTSWNIINFLSLKIERSISQNIKHFFRVGFFIFWDRKVLS